MQTPSTFAGRFFHPATAREGVVERKGVVVSACRYTFTQFVEHGESGSITQRIINLYLYDTTQECRVNDVLVAADGKRWGMQDEGGRRDGLGDIFEARVNEVLP